MENGRWHQQYKLGTIMVQEVAVEYVHDSTLRSFS